MIELISIAYLSAINKICAKHSDMCNILALIF